MEKKIEPFATIWETDVLRCYTNGSGELFVQNKNDDRTTMRIGPYSRDELIVTAYAGRFTPTSTGGLPAFVITGGRGR